jgi:hypothetical protein
MDKCKSCGNPLRILRGGQKIIDGKINNIQVMGCLNPNCSLKQQEQDRVVNEVPNFEE